MQTAGSRRIYFSSSQTERKSNRLGPCIFCLGCSDLASVARNSFAVPGCHTLGYMGQKNLDIWDRVQINIINEQSSLSGQPGILPFFQPWKRAIVTCINIQPKKLVRIPIYPQSRRRRARGGEVKLKLESGHKIWPLQTRSDIMKVRKTHEFQSRGCPHKHVGCLRARRCEKNSWR